MKLTVITINRNNAKGLLKTIQSVVSQISHELEYIVIDGASTDGSLDVIKENVSKISYWVSEPDNGIYHAMNKGILKASGDYILFLNSGDWFVENVLEYIYQQEVFGSDIVYGNALIEFNSGKTSVHKEFSRDELTFRDFYSDTICHQSTFMKRKLFVDYGLYDESFRIVSDWLYFIYIIIFKEVTVKYVDINISHVDGHGIGSSDLTLIERKKALESLLPKKILEDYEAMLKQKVQLDNLTVELNRYKNRFRKVDQIVSWVKKKIKL